MKLKFIFIYLYIILLFLGNLFNNNIEISLIYFSISYILYLIYSLMKLKSFKNVLLTPEFIFESVFLIYSIMAAIMFIIDGYKPRVDFFKIDYNTIFETLKLYLNINIVLGIIMIIKKDNTIINCSPQIEKYCKKIDSKITIWDIIAILCSIYFIYLNFRNGFSIFNTNNRILRTMISSEFNSYIYLYMISYCSVKYAEIIYTKMITKKSIMVLIITVPFWIISLLTDRRNFINLLIILFMIIISKMKKLKIKSLLKIIIVLLVFLSIGYFRANSSFSKDRIKELFYMSNGEFILSHYVSEYYINNNNDLYYGKTYIVDTLTKFIPRAIYKSKPIDLSEKFLNEAKTNVGFAFNPVAEGLINFGQFWSIIIVPFTIYFYIWLANKLYKRNIFGFLIITGYSINIFRGFFANSIFAIVFMLIIIKLMTDRRVKKL